MRKLALGLLVAGIVAMLYAFTVDTSVSVRDRVSESGLSNELAGLIPEQARVTDQGRVDNRQTFMIGGGLLALVGSVLLAVGALRPNRVAHN